MYPRKQSTSMHEALLPDNFDPPPHIPAIRRYRLNSISGAPIIKRGLDLTRDFLPECLPVYRRVQFGRFFDDTLLFTNINCGNLAALGRNWQFSSESEASSGGVEDGDGEYDDGPDPFLMALVDRSCRPETELWFFGSWEADSPPPPSKSKKAEKTWEGIYAMVRELLLELKALPLPPSIHSTTASQNTTGYLSPAGSDSSQSKDSCGYTSHDYASHASNPNIILWGAIHERTLPILKDLGVLSQAYKTGISPNSTFLFRIDDLPKPRPLPKNLKFRSVEPQDFPLVISRTQIPRQEKTLAVLPSLAIYPTASPHEPRPSPIAWAFVGLDGSLTSLHVEEEYRGQGLAKELTARLLREKMCSFWEPEVEKLAHGYVISGNKASEGMCRSLGGRSDWETYWLRVDLEKVEEGWR
jgi:ribosomal protein S18 acetylase RimI-like enzyme